MDDSVISTDTEMSDVGNDTVKNFKCGYSGCTASYNRKWKLFRHTCIHTDERPFKCSFDGCNKAYRSNSHLKRHMLTSHKEKKPQVFLPCSYAGCKAVLSNQYSLKKHCKSHLKQVYECPTCKQTFKKHNQYNVHVALHNGVFPFTCIQCELKFKNRTDMNRHARKHKSYPCDHKDCKVVSDTWSSHLKHIKLHVNMYSCNTCGKEFKTKSRVKEHVLSHVNQEERNIFVCPHKHCPRFYFQKRNLTQHINSYHEKQRFVCDHANCSKSFAYKTSLLQHKIKHDLNQPVPKVRAKRPRKSRKDKGQSHSSSAARLSGVILSTQVEKQIVLNTTTPEVENVVIGTLQLVDKQLAQVPLMEDVMPCPQKESPATCDCLPKSMLFVVTKRKSTIQF